ncbi:MAG: hypothetical protein ABSH27_06250 [Solirubrobacteraceae bacterium]|jgi:hypothetical protein
MLQTKIHGFNRRAGVLIGVVVIGALCAVAIPAASASTATTLHFFEKNLGSTFTDPSGHPVGNSKTPPPSGSAANSTAIGYVGNSAHHAKAPSASSHLACVVTTFPKAVCFAQFAIGGAMLLANQFTVSLAGSESPFSTVKINGGTGEFAGASGTVQTTPAGKGSNVTITYST